MAKPDTFHVAIVGAGVAGLALAMGLHRKGISFTLYEEAPQYSVVGAGIGFGPNGMQALDLIEPGFRPLYQNICSGNKTENNIFFELLRLEPGLGRDKPFYGKSKWGHPDYDRKSAHRKELLDVMTSFIPIDSVRFSKRLVNVEQRPDGVTLTFGDGTTAEATVLAGSDGIQSTVRAHVLGERYPNEVAPVYSGAYCYRGVIPIEKANEILGDLTDIAKTYFGQKRGCVTYRVSEGREFNFLLCVADPDKGWQLKNAITEKITHEAMMADYEDPSVDDRFRQLLSTAKPVKWGLFHHPVTSTYFRDRVVVLGDSAHASMPFQAAGAAQGIEDALVLIEVLAEIAGRPERGEAQLPLIQAGFTGYDAVRRPRAQRQLDQAHDLGLMVQGRHPETGADMEKILPRILQGRVNWLWYHDLSEDVQEALRQARALLSAGPNAASV